MSSPALKGRGKRLKNLKTGFMKKRSVYKLFLGILLFFLISFTFITKSFSEVSIGVKPTIVELSLIPGEEKTGTFTVGSNTSGKVTIKSEVENFYKNYKNVQIVDIKECIKLEPVTFELNQGETKNVTYRVKLPKDFKGEIAGMIFFEGEEPKHSGIGIKTRFGVAIYAILKGTETVDAKIDKINFEEKNDFYKLTTVVNNPGDIHIRPKGTIDIYDSNNKLLANLIMPFGFPVLPGSSYSYIVNFNKPKLPPGKYYADAKIDFTNFSGEAFQRTLRSPFEVGKSKEAPASK